MADKLETQPPEVTVYELSYPAPYVLLVTINREKSMNAIHTDGHYEGERLFQWFDDEPSLRVAVITGKGKKAFCAGQDLKMLMERQLSGEQSNVATLPPTGFGGLSRRLGKKPVIAAVNGLALGGGFELALNCDMVVASPTATFGLPEVKRGVWAGAGGIPRVVRIFGMQLASEIVLAARTLTAEEVRHHGFARIAASQDSVVPEAVALAEQITESSPDAIIISRAGLREAWETASVERAAQIMDERYMRQLLNGENIKLGLMAFASKEKPKWVPSKM
ncbi:Mevalonyl-coenzyme A hydratase sidH [Beauveria bassiana]|uniref:Enoyl-CoA hydratase n=1 Tax=Beauveria bassiana (strain ARSEF 2860) TaxID=655819 RepID=J4KMZ1_BEAB2|nr:enoyl-CoA hydratase [Beauveria bassiana ARSEF 2860]EJP64794.1 enoyl-CoA hydratase [Beauveria bassiana ARSEF 2860]KAH8712564.1 Mevalonyl-coenzyme A hydratase sidH [Beauveria bassiana]